MLQLQYTMRSMESMASGGCRYEVTYNGVFMGYFDMQRADGDMRLKNEVTQFTRAQSLPPDATKEDKKFRELMMNGQLWRFAVAADEDNKGDPDFIALLIQSAFPNSRHDGVSNDIVLGGALLDVSSSVPDMTMGTINLIRSIRAANAAKAAMTNPKPAVEWSPPMPNLKITASNPSASELRAARYMAAQGFNVELRDPVGKRIDGGTSDLVVNGVNYARTEMKLRLHNPSQRPPFLRQLSRHTISEHTFCNEHIPFVECHQRTPRNNVGDVSA